MLKVRYVRHSIHVLLLALILRKVYNGYQAMSFVNQCKGQVSFESLMKSEELRKVVQKLNSENTLILMQNQHAVNMTMNWLCNTEDMEGVHENVSIGFGRAPIDGVFGLGWPALRHFNATRPIENINPQLASPSSLFVRPSETHHPWK